MTAQSQIELTDVEAFRQIFSLKTNDPNIYLSGPDPGIANSVNQQEATLDVEWAGAVAPGATIDLVIAGTTDSTNGVDLAAVYAIDNQIAPILTYTYGSCGASNRCKLPATLFTTRCGNRPPRKALPCWLPRAITVPRVVTPAIPELRPPMVCQ